MRIFVRMDVTVFKFKGEFHYSINELTRSHQSGLFMDKSGGKMDFAIQELEKVLHFITYKDDHERKLIHH